MKIKKFVECLLPVSVCNLKCSYCYVIQRNQDLQKSCLIEIDEKRLERIFSKERWEGICYFSICGKGETFASADLIRIVKAMLSNGHYVNITTNGTLSSRIKKISEFSSEERKRIHISFSFHYIELKKRQLIDTFFSNVRLVKSLGCSYLVQLNLTDVYLPYIDEIKDICLREIGAYPQIAATRKEDSLKKIKIYSNLSDEEYIKIGEGFSSPLFSFTMKNFNVKRKEFCYAGAWTYTLNLQTGILKRCYASCIFQNIYKDVDSKIMNLAVGNSCGSTFCLNSSHFMSLGAIPEVSCPSYAKLRNREDAKWYSPEMELFLSGKLKDNNKEYTASQKVFSNVVGAIDNFVFGFYQKLKN